MTDQRSLATADIPLQKSAPRPRVKIPKPEPIIGYRTARGVMYHGLAEDVLQSVSAKKYHGKVHLILTSPPFPLNRKKKYGNLQGQKYVEWLAAFAPLMKECLSDDGSIVIEMGNAWEPGEPVMSTLALETLLAFQKSAGLKLCQQFVCYNPARLPTPTQWVNVERIRVKDSYTHVWWMSPTAKPKADNRRVLTAYSSSMVKLLRTGKYNSGSRPSEHRLGKDSFLKDNEGAIPSNVLTLTNTDSNDPYLNYCRQRDLPIHPARMPAGLAEFFVNFLTDADDLVLDPFAGSNTTGSVAERLGRQWLAIEPKQDYIKGSRGRFAECMEE